MYIGYWSADRREDVRVLFVYGGLFVETLNLIPSLTGLRRLKHVEKIEKKIFGSNFEKML